MYVVHNEREERQQEKRKKKKQIKEDNVKVTGRKSEMREEDPAQAWKKMDHLKWEEKVEMVKTGNVNILFF